MSGRGHRRHTHLRSFRVQRSPVGSRQRPARVGRGDHELRQLAEQGRLRQQGRRDLPANRRGPGKGHFSPKGNLKATATYLRTSADLIDAELSKLRKLSKPKADRGRLGDLLSREGDAISTLRRAATAADAGQQSTADTLFTQAQGELSDVGAGLHDYGFTVCGT